MPDTVQPSTRSTDLVTLTILVQGEALPLTIQIYSVDIWKELNRIPRAKLVIIDGDPAAETFLVSSEEWFVPGKDVEIQAGYHSEEQTVFKGIVSSQSIKVRDNGNSILVVECSDPAVKMSTVPKSKYFYDISESDIFGQIIGSYGLESDIEQTSYTHRELLQYQSTDWDFILSRTDINGLFCSVEGGKVSLKRPDFTRGPSHVITYGRNLLEIDAEMEASSQLAGVQSVSWDYSGTEISRMSATSESPVSPGNLSSTDLASAFNNPEWQLSNGAKIPDEVLQVWTNAKLMKHELAKIRGRARIRGVSSILPGDIVKLEGLGDRFNGHAFVSGIKHGIHDGVWVTDVQFGLSPDWFSEQFDISSQKASGMLPSVSGLQVGLVTQVDNDPDGDERILVRLPVVDDSEQGIWARMATAGAGNNRGVVIRPEVDDEVIVGFINDDPGQPVILGSVNSAGNPAPIEATEENQKKGWVTRGEIRLMIDDDTPSVRIEMPSGKQFLLDDESDEILLEDDNGNKITMTSSGISLDSSSDITLKASGNIKLEAGASLSAEAGASFKAEGSASAELRSSGTTIVNGSLVQIN